MRHESTDDFVRTGILQFAFSGTALSVVVRYAFFAALLYVALTLPAVAQDMALPGTESLGVDNGAPQVVQSGGGSFLSQDLGTILRLRYNTESYGQNGHGNFDVGTMQVFSFDDSTVFFDGQVTMNDVQGVGFNVGMGHRWMHYPSLSPLGRMHGLSIWADGTSSDEGGFFPQIGLSAESLGEVWDFRANGYIPVGQDDQLGDFEGTGVTGFSGFSVGELTQAVLNSSYYAAEFEVARRLGVERDAWAFAGPYFIAHDSDNSADNDNDSPGIRAGLRGYAYPDLMLQIGVTHDDIFDTNATFSVIWFVGRTRTDFRPACGVQDRFREPVLRNDYVVLSQSFIAGVDAFTQPDGEALRFVHVDSTAGPGGDGTFENPFDNLSDVNGAGSQEGDVILAHAESVFTGDASTILKDEQRLLGEGDGFEATIATNQGTFLIPETAPGARDAARPMIVGAAPGGDAIVLADGNEVANFDIDGAGTTARAIASPAAGSGNPNLHDLAISDTTGNAIDLTPLEVVDTDDVDNDGNTTETFVRGNVTIDEATFDNIGGDDIHIDATTTADITLPNVTLQEVINLTNITSTNGNGTSINVENTHSGAGRTVSVNNFTYDGGATSDGAIRLFNFDSTFVATNSTITNGDPATGAGVSILDDSDGTITLANTFVFNNFDGTSFLVNGDTSDPNEFGGTVVVQGAINNDTGNSVSIDGVGAGSVTLSGDINDMGDGIRVQNNGAGLILFAGDLTMETETSNAIELTNNDDDGGAAATDIDFTGQLDITTTSGTGFDASNGGNLTVSGNNNSITTETGQIARIIGMNIDALGANFNEVNRTMAGATAIQLDNNTGGPITFGNSANDTPGDSGTIEGGAADTIVIRDSRNVTLSALRINNTALFSGILVDKTMDDPMLVNLNDLEINDGDRGIEVTASAGVTGDLDMTINDTDINNSTAFGMSFNNVDNGTIDVNNVTIDGDPANAGAVGVHIEDSDATFDFDSATTIQDFAGTNFEVDGGEGVITFAGEIDNTVAGGGRSVHITDLQGGSVTFSPASMITDTNTGILVDANDDGLILFAGELDMDTAGNDAITLTNNTGTDIDFTGLVDINTTGGDGFTATGGGNLTVTGTTNRIQTDTGQIAVITGMTIDAGGVNFGFADRNMAAATSAIQLENNVGTGAIVFGSAANQTAGDNGTIVGGGADTILVRNTANATFNALIVNNAATFSGFRVDKTNNNSMNVTVNDTTINDGAFGVNVTGNGTTGNLNMTIADVDILDSTTAGLSFDDVDAGTINVNNTTIDGNNASAGGQGVIIANSNATFNFDSSTVIQEFGGTDFEVDGGTPVVSFAGDIINRSDVNAADTTGRSVDVNSITGGSVTFTAASSIRDDNQGLIVGGPLAADGNSGGVISFLGTMEFDTVAADAVTVQNNTGTTNVIFDGLDIVTTTGDGVLITSNASTTSVMITDVDVTTTTGNAFTATSGGNLTVAGANNVITTTTGTGLTIDGMNIVTQASFESVTVNGAANGIVLENVTGAQVTVGETAGAADSGGTLTTTAEAIIVRNVQNADLNNIRVADSGADAVVIEHTGAGTTNMDVTVDSLNLDAATGDGVAVAYQSNTNDFVLRFVDSTLEENFVASVTGNNLFQMRVENTDINVAGTTDAFATTFSGSATDAELILRNVNFTATDASAAFIDASGGTAKTVDLLIEDSSFENSSAGNPSVEINSQGSSTMNATIQGNTFDNAAGTDFDISSDGAAARMRLNLGGDPASPSDFNTAAGGGQFELFENGGSDFDVFEMVDTFGNLRNNGTVDGNGGTYDDLPVAPVPPVIP